MSETLTRQHLAEAVYAQVGLSRNESSELVDRVLEEVSQRLVRGETVKLSLAMRPPTGMTPIAS